MASYVKLLDVNRLNFTVQVRLNKTFDEVPSVYSRAGADNLLSEVFQNVSTAVLRHPREEGRDRGKPTVVTLYEKDGDHDRRTI